MSSRILPSVAILIAIAIFFTYVRPQWVGPIAETKQAIELDRQALDAAKQYKERENELASARNNIDPANIKRIEAFLPDSVDNVGLILNINALAARSQLVLSNVDVVTITSNSSGTGSAAAAAPAKTTGAPTVGSGAAAVSPVGSVDVSLTAVGSYEALQQFLKGVEKSARLLDLRDIVVTSSETGVYNYRMNMRLYWLR